MRKSDGGSTPSGGSGRDRYAGPAKPEMTLADLAEAGIPVAVGEWIVSRQRARSDDPHVQRGARLVDHYRQGDAEAKELSDAWSRLARAARSDDDLVAFFAAFPDGPEAEPFARVFGRRHVDAGEERRRYKVNEKRARALLPALQYENLQRLAADAQATGARAVAAYRSFALLRRDLVRGLSAYAELLDCLDPTAKLLTQQYASTNISLTNYRHQLARLNRYLSTPAHAAIAAMAQINCPDHQVLSNTLGQIWRRGDKATQSN